MAIGWEQLSVDPSRVVPLLRCASEEEFIAPNSALQMANRDLGTIQSIDERERAAVGIDVYDY